MFCAVISVSALVPLTPKCKSLDWESPQVQMLDLQYHDLRPDKGLYFLLVR